MTVSHEELAALIEENFIQSPTPEGMARFVLAHYHVVERLPEEDVDFNPNDKAVTVRGQRYTLDFRTSTATMAREKRSVQIMLTVLDAARQVHRDERKEEIEKLANVLHSVSDATFVQCVEQARELIEAGVSFMIPVTSQKNP